MSDPVALREVEVAIARGGTSRGVIVRMTDLADAGVERDRQTSALIGARVVDGLGGGSPVTDKVVLVGAPTRLGADLDYIVGNVGTAGMVDWSGTCGNMTSAVVPYALAVGLAEPAAGATPFVLHNLATGQLVEVALAGTSWPVEGASVAMTTTYLHPGGSVLGRTLPTGRARDLVEVGGKGYDYSLIDVTHPYLLLRHEQVVGQCDHEETEARIEEIRGRVCLALGLCATADEASSASASVPRVVLVHADRPPGADVRVTAVSMGRTISSVPVTAGVAVAAGRALGGTILGGETSPSALEVVVAGPAGQMPVRTSVADDGTVLRATVHRTARLLMRGRAWIPESVADLASS